MERIAVTLCLFLVVSISYCQDNSLDYISALTGRDIENEMDEYEIEQYLRLLKRPIQINYSGKSELTRIMSPYQAASLLDYIKKNGQVHSYTELSLIDGFNRNFVERIKPFVSLFTTGSFYKSRNSADAVIKTGIRLSQEGSQGANDDDNQKKVIDTKYYYGLKSRYETDRLSVALSIIKPNDSNVHYPKDFSTHISYDFKRAGCRLIAGDFNARFGQGLCLWNGASISGYSSVQSIYKHATGITPAYSYNGLYSLTGLAASFAKGDFSICGGLALPNIREKKMDMMPLLNFNWNGRSGGIGLSVYCELISPVYTLKDCKFSIDTRWCIKGVDIYGEISSDIIQKTVSALAGVCFPVCERLKMGAVGRYYPSIYDSSRSVAVSSTGNPSNEYGLSISGDFHFGKEYHQFKGNFVIDAAYFPKPKAKNESHCHQIKALMLMKMKLTEYFNLDIRLQERYRSWGYRFRTDLRTDLKFQLGNFNITNRINLLHCKSLSFLTYIEGGYQVQDFAIFIRQGFFVIDNWDDRIYAYERDAPGSFNVPAYYGRGLWTAISGRWKFAKWGRTYLRFGYTAHPQTFKGRERPTKFEVKLQFNISF